MMSFSGSYFSNEWGEIPRIPTFVVDRTHLYLLIVACYKPVNTFGIRRGLFYIILGFNREVERSSHPSRKLLKQRSARFSYLVIILLCFSYKPLLIFLLTGASHVHFMVAIFCLLEHVLITSIVCEVIKQLLTSFFFYYTFIYYLLC